VDARFVVDWLSRLNEADPSGRFTGPLDLSRLGVFGHSLGGATALQFCHDDSRCKAAINEGIPFGSSVQEGTLKPSLLLFENLDFSSTPKDQERRELFTKLRLGYAHLGSGHMLMMGGANHFSFGDVILMKSQYLVRVILP
jgi:hypothetical protein